MNWLFSSTLGESGVPLLERVDFFALHAGDFAHAVLGFVELRDLDSEASFFGCEVADLDLQVLVLEVRVHELAHGFVDRVFEAHQRDLVLAFVALQLVGQCAQLLLFLAVAGVGLLRLVESLVFFELFDSALQLGDVSLDFLELVRTDYFDV